MRTTQFIGLSEAAIEWLEENCITTEIKTCPTCGHVDGGELKSEGLGLYVEGMFEEKVHEFRRFTTKDGKKIIEYIQAVPWSSGPCIFLALKYEDANEPIEESLWDEDEINNA